MIFAKKTIESVCKMLSLPFTGIEQDWEVEFANPERVNEFIYYYRNNILSQEEKKALMSLIFASYDDYLNKYEIDEKGIWSEIVLLVRSDKYLFNELISYWSLEGDTSQDYFKITPLVRNIFN